MEKKEENNLSKDHVLQITNELYRLTLLFPKREPLRYKMRELADEVLANFVSLPQENNQPIKITIVKNADKALEILDSFFDIAKSQNWVKPSDMLSLQREYSKMRQELVRLKKEVRKKKVEKEEVEAEKILFLKEEEEKPITERQKKILKVLGEKGKMQVWEIKTYFSDVSKRTLRRDFKNLVNQGLVERKGERNNTFYQLKNRTELIKIGQR